ncbi:MAG: L-threonylcarbamoyladenylate synthase [Steroidobacteraceae bacterium]
MERVTAADLEAAVRALRAGELVAFPTETVYGLGADAGNSQAVRRIFALKGRPARHPVIVHLHDVGQLPEWAREVPPAARRLAEQFWPGPLTLVLPRCAAVDDSVTGGQDTVALRVPAHPVAQQLLSAFGGGIAAPSANRYGRLSPTRAEHVREEFGDAVKLVLDGGDCPIGLESTIVAFQHGAARLLRPGRITAADIRALIGELAIGADLASPRVPGSTAAHYAPTTPLSIVAAEQIDAHSAALARDGRRIAVLAWRAPRAAVPSVTWIDAAAHAPQYGHDLYAHLRRLDKGGFERILVQEVPEGEAWAAIRDRLRRAAAGAGSADANTQTEAP